MKMYSRTNSRVTVEAIRFQSDPETMKKIMELIGSSMAKDVIVWYTSEPNKYGMRTMLSEYSTHPFVGNITSLTIPVMDGVGSAYPGVWIVKYENGDMTCYSDEDCNKSFCDFTDDSPCKVAGGGIGGFDNDSVYYPYQIRDMFVPHDCDETQKISMKNITMRTKEVADMINNDCPDCVETRSAIQHLVKARMMANLAISSHSEIYHSKKLDKKNNQ